MTSMTFRPVNYGPCSLVLVIDNYAPKSNYTTINHSWSHEKYIKYTCCISQHMFTAETLRLHVHRLRGHSDCEHSLVRLHGHSDCEHSLVRLRGHSDCEHSLLRQHGHGDCQTSKLGITSESKMTMCVLAKPVIWYVAA